MHISSVFFPMYVYKRIILEHMIILIGASYFSDLVYHLTFDVTRMKKSPKILAQCFTPRLYLFQWICSTLSWFAYYEVTRLYSLFASNYILYRAIPLLQPFCRQIIIWLFTSDNERESCLQSENCRTSS